MDENRPPNTRPRTGHGAPEVPDYPFHRAAVASAWPPRDTAPAGYMEPIRSAGAVVWRPAPGGGVHIALVHRPSRDDWSLPKGKVKGGEHLVTAAVRETEEEAGVRPVLGRRLPPQRYLRDGWPKLVDWWAARAGAETGFIPGDEVDGVAWLSPAEARERLTYDHDVAVLDTLVSGPLDTVPLVLLRHTSAGDKRGWTGSDLLRPLDAQGREDAQRLAGVLAAFAPMRVVTSAAARCTETVLPYAVGNAAEVRTANALTAGLQGDPSSVDPAGAASEAGRLLDAGRPVLVCTHGELIPTLLRHLLGLLGAPATQQPSLRKGDFWVLHLGPGRTLAAIERHSATG
ncbi:NUDIX hydrolase [Nocardiopsis coralliicola]